MSQKVSEVSQEVNEENQEFNKENQEVNGGSQETKEDGKTVDIDNVMIASPTSWFTCFKSDIT